MTMPMLRVIKKPGIGGVDAVGIVEFFIDLHNADNDAKYKFKRKSKDDYERDRIVLITSESVRKMFVEAIGTKRPLVPALEHCAIIARALNQFRLTDLSLTILPPRYAKAREYLQNALAALAKENDKNAKKYWRLARENLAKEIEDHARQIWGRKENYHAVLAGRMNDICEIEDPLIDRALSINAAHALMETWGEYDAVRITWHVQAQWFGDLAQEAWRKAGGAVPRGKAEDSPLVAFLEAALAAIGKNMSRTAISAALRERRGGGKASKAKA